MSITLIHTCGKPNIEHPLLFFLLFLSFHACIYTKVAKPILLLKLSPFLTPLSKPSHTPSALSSPYLHALHPVRSVPSLPKMSSFPFPNAAIPFLLFHFLFHPFILTSATLKSSSLLLLQFSEGKMKTCFAHSPFLCTHKGVTGRWQG